MNPVCHGLALAGANVEVLGSGCPGDAARAVCPCSCRMKFQKNLPGGGRVPLPCGGWFW